MENNMLITKIYPLIEKLSKKMACESAKCYSTAIYTTIMVVLSLQLLGTIEKQVFDFLGYMWAPIIGNFFQIICTILGIFGTYQYRPKFIAVYSTWSLIWLGWNIFVICLYLEVGVLNRDREMYILSIGTKSKSWWLEHGIGCKIINDTWVQTVQSEGGRKIPPEEFVEGCILAYYYVEVIHAGIQCLLALTGFVFTLMAIYIYSEEQEQCKYPARTYVSPNDYPSAHYACLDAVQHIRNNWGMPEHVTYADAMTWSTAKEAGEQNPYTKSNVQEVFNQTSAYLDYNQQEPCGIQTGYGNVQSGQYCESVIQFGNQSRADFPKGDYSYNDYMSSCARMRNCDSGHGEESVYSSRTYNSGSLWAHNSNKSGGSENVSAV